MDMYKNIEAAAEAILTKSKYKPEIGLVLGSGLGSLGDEIEDAEIYEYKDIPNFPVSTAEGHAGRLIMGKLQGKVVVCMQGRFHYYEGYTIQQVTFPIRVMKKLGVEVLIVTNAAGAVNQSFHPGSLMIITDHINLSGNNPLIGKNLEDFGVRFPDMSEAYDKKLREKALSAGSKLGIAMEQGVYACFTGPTYETPAEIRMARTLGADAVGMSTVPEVIVAVHSGMKVLGISCMTNMAAGILDQPLCHEEVLETSQRVKDQFIQLMKNIVCSI